MTLLPLAVCLVASGVSWLAVGCYRAIALRFSIVDLPNERSSHIAPVPRGAGVGILVGAVAGLLTAEVRIPAFGLLGTLVAGGLLVATVGWWDDWRRGAPLLVRLVVQFAAAILLVTEVGFLERIPLPAPLDWPLGSAAPLLTMLWLVGVTNLYNFLDGIDGLAGLQAVTAGLILAFAIWPAPEALLALAMAGGAAGFLIHNWQPAQVFMGDVGSATLGFLFAGIPLSVGGRVDRGSSDLFLLTALALWYFLADGLFTVVRRAASGERIWEPHRSHLYQRLVRAGWSHGTVAATLGAASALTGAVALYAYLKRSPWLQCLSLVLAVVGGISYWMIVVRAESRTADRSPEEGG